MSVLQTPPPLHSHSCCCSSRIRAHRQLSCGRTSGLHRETLMSSGDGVKRQALSPFSFSRAHARTLNEWKLRRRRRRRWSRVQCERQRRRVTGRVGAVEEHMRATRDCAALLRGCRQLLHACSGRHRSGVQSRAPVSVHLNLPQFAASEHHTLRASTLKVCLEALADELDHVRRQSGSSVRAECQQIA